MHRWLGVLLLSVALVLSWGAGAGAHGSDLSAIISLEPQPNRTAALTVSLLDAYGARVSRARVRASLRKDGAQAPVPAVTTEPSPGRYEVTLPLPEADLAIGRLEVGTLGDQFVAEFPLVVQEGMSEIGVSLRHRAGPAGTRAGTFDPRGGVPSDPGQILAILAVIGLPVILALLMQRRRGKG